MNLFIGNISFKATDEDLKKLFEEHGTVKSAKIITDRVTGKSKGFGFVEMESETSGNKAILSLNQLVFLGRALGVSRAMPKQ